MRTHRSCSYLIALLITICFVMPCLAANYYVDAGNGPGSHTGTMQDPFQTIAEATSVAAAGDAIHIAGGFYYGAITIPDGVELRGGYSRGFVSRDTDLYPTAINGEHAEKIVTAQGQFHLDGLTITNGVTGVYGADVGSSVIHDCSIYNIIGGDAESAPLPPDGETAYGIFLTGDQITISYCMIENIHGGKGGGSTSSANRSGNGGSGYGMMLHAANPRVMACTIDNISGGSGGNGIVNHSDGGLGGDAFGIAATAGSLFGYLPDISHNMISNITAGNGGNGGVEWDYGGNSANGGNATGIRFDNYTKAGTLTGNHVTSVTGGRGGQTAWAHFVAGGAGDAGSAMGISLSNVTDAVIQDNIIKTISGNLGGKGGSAGDFPGSGDSTQGGDGGNAWGIHDTTGSSNHYINNLVTAIKGGYGNEGGTFMQTSSCSSGGLGGSATGIDLTDGEHFVQQNTVNLIKAGNGGNGGESYWPAQAKSQTKSVRQPVTTVGNQNSGKPILTPTPSPTPGPGYICCGSGGNGGYAVGIRFPHCDFMERYKCNIVTDVQGGMAGDCFNPSNGEGVGMEKLDLCSVIIDYNNVFEYTTVAYRNMAPGPNTVNADPLFTTGGKGDHYLSQYLAGQTSDSPCVDAGDSDAATVYPPDEYTTRTDHIADLDQVDLGFHYAMSGTPTPNPTATITPTPTGTPDDYLVWVDLDIPLTDCHPGDSFYCHLNINNVSDIQFSDFPQFVILDIAGTLFFAPAFSAFDYYHDDIMPGQSQIVVLPPFIWPENSGSMSAVWVYAAVTDPQISALVSNFASVSFSWSD